MFFPLKARKHYFFLKEQSKKRKTIIVSIFRIKFVWKKMVGHIEKAGQDENF